MTGTARLTAKHLEHTGNQCIMRHALHPNNCQLLHVANALLLLVAMSWHRDVLVQFVVKAAPLAVWHH
jgi:hypothetical protein